MASPVIMSVNIFIKSFSALVIMLIAGSCCIYGVETYKWSLFNT